MDGLYTSLLGIVPSRHTTDSITVTFMFYSFEVILSSPGTYHSFHFVLFWLYGLLWQQGPLFGRFSFLLAIITSGCLAEIRWSVCISKSPKRMCVSFSRTDSGLCIFHLFIWSDFLGSIPSWLPSPHRHIEFYTLFSLIYCIHLLYDPLDQKLFFLLTNSRCSLLVLIRWFACISNIFMRLILSDVFWFVYIPFWWNGQILISCTIYWE